MILMIAGIVLGALILMTIAFMGAMHFKMPRTARFLDIAIKGTLIGACLAHLLGVIVYMIYVGAMG